MKTYTTTERKYDEMLGVLPPAAMSTGVHGIHGFLVGEPTDHDKDGQPRYAAYFKCDDEYVESEPLTVPAFRQIVNLTEKALRDDETTPDEVAKELELREKHGDGPVDAYLALEDTLDGFEEAYVGKYDNDEDFARQMAEDVGAMKDTVSWPYTCIDWGQAARDFMFDYCEENHYYFNEN